MEIKLIGNGTKEEVVAQLNEKIKILEDIDAKKTKSEIIDLVKDFVEEAKKELERDVVLEDRLRTVSTAGQLSREKGTVLDVYERRTDKEKNQKLATAVIGYGHKTISEHDYLVFALQNVSRFVEQTVISYRLTSFTIKSGRNVDFRTAGYYAPDFRDKDGKILPNNDKLKKMYQKYMDSIFAKYGDYVDQGVPVEEARYTLPFGYKTNIVMGCDANEFFRVTCDLLYGKSSHITELHELGLEFEKILKEKCPYLADSLAKEEGKKRYQDNLAFLDESFAKVNDHSKLEWYDPTLDYNTGLLERTKLVGYTPNADYVVVCHAIAKRYGVSYAMAEEMFYRFSQLDRVSKNDVIRGVYENRRQRELEQALFTFEAPIELSILPQMTRHRMQSLEVPDFVPLWDVRNHLYPDHDVDKNEHIPKEEYEELFENNALMLETFKKEGVRDEDLIYFYLGGNACNILTSMNARELIWFSRMRSCNKAQKGIRNISNQMVAEVSKVSPGIGSLLGPSCKVEGICPEGKDSCKARGVVVLKKEKKD